MNITTARAVAPACATAHAESSAEQPPAPGHWLLAPHSLLLASGTLLGLKLPMGKLANEAGVSVLVWAGIVSLGVVIMLLPTQLTRRGLRLPGIAVMRYTMVSAVISFIVPNLLLFTVIPKVGAGYTGLMFALSPVFTLLIAALLGMKTSGRLGLVGIATGLVGAVVVSLTRSVSLHGPDLGWLLAAGGRCHTCRTGKRERLSQPVLARGRVAKYAGVLGTCFRDGRVSYPHRGHSANAPACRARGVKGSCRHTDAPVGSQLSAVLSPAARWRTGAA